MTLAEIISASSVGYALTRLRGWQQFGARLASHRASARMSISAVSRLSGVEWSRVRAIESGCPGFEPPTDREIGAICRALLVDPSAFLEQAAELRRN